MPDLSSAQTKYLSRLKREKYFVNISRLVLFAGFLALWEVSARIGWIDSFIFSSPSAIGLNFLDMCRNQSLFTHIGITLTAVSYTHLDVYKRQTSYGSNSFHAVRTGA